MKVKSEPPVLAAFMERAFGDNWHLKGGWRTPKPGSRVVTKAEQDAVIAEWRDAWKKWEASNG
jgi:hypothetical protein